MEYNEIYNSYSFLHWYFNDLIWLTSDENQMRFSEKRDMVKIILDYKNRFRLKAYSNEHIWKIINYKFYKNFDELLYINY